MLDGFQVRRQLLWVRAISSASIDMGATASNSRLPFVHAQKFSHLCQIPAKEVLLRSHLHSWGDAPVRNLRLAVRLDLFLVRTQ